MKKLLTIVLFASLFSICSAQESGVSTKEAGIYQRKSVAFLNTVVNKGGVLSREWSQDIVELLQNSVRFERFDYNNIPQSIVDKFVEMPTSVSIEERMNATIVPAILSAVDAQKEIRAMNLLSDQQRNSFITDKAKELGITEDELNAVMNSAYIFAPVYLGYADSSYATQSYGTAYKITLAAAGYWWKIDNTGEKPQAKLIAHIERTYSSTKYSGEEYTLNGKPINYKYAAFRGALSVIASDVQMATKEIPDFQLSAQILSRNIRNVVISLGKNEGIKTDDKFWAYESIEDVDGNVTSKKHGWIMVRNVGEKAKGLDSAQSQAQIISGNPYIGSTVKEIPHFPVDVTFGFTKSPFSIDAEGQRMFDKEYAKLDSNSQKDSSYMYGMEIKYLGDVRHLYLSNAYGPKFKLGFNLLNNAGGSQWWFNVGGEFLFAKASGKLYRENYYEYEITNAMAFGWEASLTKKIYIRRFAFAPEIGFGMKDIMLMTKKENDYPTNYKDVYASQWSLGVSAILGVEVALAPLFNLGGSAGYQLYGGSRNSWKLRYYSQADSSYKDGETLKSGDKLKSSGFLWSAYVSFAVPSGSKKHNDLVSNDISAPKANEEDAENSGNEKFKENTNATEPSQKTKSGNSGGGGFWKLLF